jgi:hypothetical protein
MCKFKFYSFLDMRLVSCDSHALCAESTPSLP